MRTQVTVLAVALLVMVGCSTTIGDINLRPAKYYQEKLTVVGRITRMQPVADGALLEIADARDHVLYVHTKQPVEAGIGEWVKATGVLVPETTVQGQRLYDVVEAEDISTTRAPILPNLL